MCSNSEDYDPDGKFSLPMTFKKNFGCLITDDMVKELIVSLLKRKSITQDELQKHGILESSIEKYGLEHLVAGGYKKTVYNQQYARREKCLKVKI